VTHGIEDTALTHQHHQDYRGETSQDSYSNRGGQPAISRHISLNGISYGSFLTSSFEFFIIRHTREYVAEEYIKNGTNHQRTEDANRHIAFRILGLLCGGGYGIKTNEGEEYNGRATQYTTPTM